MFDLACPACGRKLPYARAKTNTDKSVRVWTRQCECGAIVQDDAAFTRTVIYPESDPIPTFKHPGEGGMGP
jgi:hypothetical protein